MYDLIRFLRDRFDEDEQLARRALTGPWETVAMGGIVGVYAVDAHEMVSLVDSTDDLGAAPNADHIVRHAPDRVLAELAIKRQLLDTSPGMVAPLLARAYHQHPDFPAHWLPPE